MPNFLPLPHGRHLYHIPFCKQACHYCDFHFSTSLKYKDELLQALVREIRLQKTYLKGETIETIYFGGGTPSLLSDAEINLLINTITGLHTVASDAEITLEANPDDLDKNKVRSPKHRLIAWPAGVVHNVHGGDRIGHKLLAFLWRKLQNREKPCGSGGIRWNLYADLIFELPNPAAYAGPERPKVKKEEPVQLCAFINSRILSAAKLS